MRKIRSSDIFQAQQLELMLVVCVIVVCASSQALFYIHTIYKAAMIEPINLMRPLQQQVVERLAFTGVWEESTAEGVPLLEPIKSSLRESRSRFVASAKGLEELNAGFARSEAAAAEIGGLGSRRSTSSNAVVGLSDGSPMAAVATGFLKTPAIIELRPVVNMAEPALVNWACGKQVEIAGIRSRTPREPAVPDTLLPLPCRSQS